MVLAGVQPVVTGSAGQDRVRVLIVDDSAVVRGLTRRILETNESILVVATVGDGAQAVRAVEKHDIDVVVLDIEMPIMDGLTALPLLLQARPGLRVIMSSTLTTRNAGISLQALERGAADYIPKPTSSKEIHGGGDFRRELIEKVLALGRTARRNPKDGVVEREKQTESPISVSAPVAVRKPGVPDGLTLRQPGRYPPDVLAIGSSTGGPQALFTFFKGLDPAFDLPVLITQHMPPTFTTILATHIGSISGRICIEAAGGEPVVNGTVYVAPGGMHMVIERRGAQVVTVLSDEPPENFCKPSVNPMLRSIVKLYGPRVLTVILTGMGHDGLKGCEAVIEAGGSVIGQDEGTSIVWGMPGAVATNGLCSAVLPLEKIAEHVSNFSKRTAS